MDILKKYKNPWSLYEQEIPHSRFCDDSSVGFSPAEKLSPHHLQLLGEAFTSAKHERQTRGVSGHGCTRARGGERQMATEEFCEVIRAVMGSEAKEEWVMRFFDEVDVRGTGRVSWPQLCSYLLLEYAERSRASVSAPALLNSHIMFKHCSHNKREPTVRVVAVFHSPSLRYISVSKGGQVTLWNSHLQMTESLRLAGDPTEEVAHTKRFRGWVTDAVYMSNVRKLAISTDCRDLHFINVCTTNAFEDFHLYGFPCVVTAVCYWCDIQYPFEPSLLLVGDEMGGVHVLQFLNPTKCLFKSVTKKKHGLQRIYFHHLRDHEGTVSYRYITSVHQQPVNRIMFESGPRVIMTSSESSVTSLVFFNLSEKQSRYIWKVTGGVTCFDYNACLQLIVTGSSDCAVRLWARYVTTRPVATLLGHHAAVLDVAIYQPVEQIFSYSRDAELRIWGITAHECLKIVRLHFPCLQAAQIPEHGNFPFLLLSPPLPDETRPRLLVGCKDYLALLSLAHKQRGGRGEGLGHQLGGRRSKAALSCALFNPTLQQVVTGTTDSTLCVWDLSSGEKKLHISNAHGEEELSSMTLDSSQRRLITAARNGSIKVWSLLNGLNLHKLEPLANIVSGLLCLHDDHLIVVGLTHCIVEYDLASCQDLHVKAKASWMLRIPQQLDVLALCHCPAMAIIATATHKGDIIVWKLETQMPVLHLSKKSSSGEVLQVDSLMFLQHRAVHRSLRHKGVLVSSQAGFIVFWSVTGQTHPYGHFCALEKADDRILALSSNQSENTVLVSGDTAGWLQVWHISHYGLDIQDQVVNERPPLLQRWRAHSGALVSVEVLEMRERLFILSASADGSAGLWTQDGDRVGWFGEEARWNLMDPCTFQAQSDTQSSLTEERRDKTQSPSHEPSGSSQTSQRGESKWAEFEKEHHGPQPTLELQDVTEDSCVVTVLAVEAEVVQAEESGRQGSMKGISVWGMAAKNLPQGQTEDTSMAPQTGEERSRGIKDEERDPERSESVSSERGVTEEMTELEMD